jgi:hypothetical protein
MELWCSFGTDHHGAHRRLASVMERLYGVPFGSFERYCPVGTPERIAEVLATYVDAGCRTFNLIPVAASVEEAIVKTAEVRELLTGHSAVAATGT